MLSDYLFILNGYHYNGVNGISLGVGIVESAVIQMHLQNRGTESNHNLVIIHTLIPTAVSHVFEMPVIIFLGQIISRISRVFVKKPKTTSIFMLKNVRCQ